MTQRFESLNDATKFRQDCLKGLTKSDPLFVLDSRGWEADSFSRYEWIIAWGMSDVLSITQEDPDAFSKMQHFSEKHTGEWVFAALSYDLKNCLEVLPKPREARIPFPLARLVVPRHVISCRRVQGTWVAEGDLNDVPPPVELNHEIECGDLSAPGEQEYHRAFNEVRRHIQRGDIFEANLCIEFHAGDAMLDPFYLFEILGRTSPAPFSCLMRDAEKFLISASPERFIRGDHEMAMSQPMKGTAPRSPDPAEDERQRFQLMNSEKERAENIMIVDLVRNDLGRSAEDAGVWVEELCTVYPFPSVWQMISTVCCKPRQALGPFHIIANAFPMGSMTGAPKVRAMQIIDELENFGRGMFSGSVGYVNPEGEYDFNVVIRSLQYDSKNRKISFAAGGAITSGSEADSEYRECLLKASAIAGLLRKPFITFAG